jgi:serine/threonine protein kinase
MKLIEGEDWQKSITRRAREENLKIFEVIAKAVAYAHEEGIIHRDLKPENVMIGRYDEIFLTDWGMARDLHSKDEIPSGGSPEFMAPEATFSYKANEAHDIDERSDVYSVSYRCQEAEQTLPRKNK